MAPRTLRGIPLAAALLAAPLAAQAPARPGTGDPWRIIPLPQASQVYARDGALIGEIGREIRTSVPIASLPRYVPQAFVAMEDQRFYQHDGVDLVGIAGALKDGLLGHGRGASTITQQLVGNMHPDQVDRRDMSLGRKIREQQAAREMEKHYSKAQILEAYLNTINFGHGWYGVESAARHYFGKPASRLTLAEAASLAALPKSPVGYDPARFPDRNRERRNTVLSLMVEQGYLSAAQAAAAEADPVVTAPDGGMAAPAPYFVDAVRQQAERLGIPVMNGGYRIVTTLDAPLQRDAVVALDEGLRAVEARPGYRHPTFAKRAPASADYLQGLVVAMEPATGEVRALVGGRDYAASQFDRATAALRQPGSAFKPFVYATAIHDSLVTAATMMQDTALAVPLGNGAVYRPWDADHRFLGPLTVREALARSRNSVAVQLALRVGMDSVAALAHALGISTPISPYAASAIGASVVRPIELVAAYTAFPNLGASTEPIMVQRVEDRAGKVLYAGRAPAFRAGMDAGTAFIVRDMMRDVVDRGTAATVRRWVPASIPVAGKTGTTNDNTDVWFVGMTPELVAGVWLGFDQPQGIVPGAAGGSLAAPVWGRMVSRWYAGRQPAQWVPPAGVVSVEMDRQTALPADSLTPPERRYTEYFLDGTQPGAQHFDPWALFRYGPVIGF